MQSIDWITHAELALNGLEAMAGESFPAKRRINALRSRLKQRHDLRSRKAFFRACNALLESKLIKSAAWKTMMSNLLNGVGRELRTNAPLRTKRTLHALQNRLKASRVLRSRKAFEQEVEAFLQSESHLQAATSQYIKRIVPPVIADAMAALKQAKEIRARHLPKPRILPNPD
ncbi:MAG: hypothetical protein ABSH19_07245 [Opitutales bacterium]|jgi:hypothetical protein